MGPYIRENLLHFQRDGWVTTYATSHIQWDTSPFGMTEDLDNKTPAQKDKRLNLIRQMEMDATDLILHLIKKQPRIVGSELYSYTDYVDRVQHNYQRDAIRENGSWIIYYKHEMIGRLIHKPHASITLFNVGDRGKTRYAQGVFVRVANDLLPIKIRKD